MIFPTTRAPISESLPVTTQCADNANVSGDTSLQVTCGYDGTWSSPAPQCQCSKGYKLVSVGDRQLCQS